MSTALPATLLSRIEDASINASAPPQQRWVDGWLLRFSPGKAKRTRCVQAVAEGRLPLDERLALCHAVMDAAGLPLVVRLTPFSLPAGLDDALGQEDQGEEDGDDMRQRAAQNPLQEDRGGVAGEFEVGHFCGVPRHEKRGGCQQHQQKRFQRTLGSFLFLFFSHTPWASRCPVTRSCKKASNATMIKNTTALA